MADIRPLDIEPPVPGATPAGPRRLSAAVPTPAGFPRETPEMNREGLQRRLSVLDLELNDPEATGDPAARAAVERESATLRQQLGAQPAAPSAPPAAPQQDKVPTWSEVAASPKFQALDEKGRESVRASYWRDVVSPMVPTEELEVARAEFDKISRPSMLQRAGKAIKGALSGLSMPDITGGDASTADASAISGGMQGDLAPGAPTIDLKALKQTFTGSGPGTVKEALQEKERAQERERGFDMGPPSTKRGKPSDLIRPQDEIGPQNGPMTPFGEATPLQVAKELPGALQNAAARRAAQFDRFGGILLQDRDQIERADAAIKEIDKDDFQRRARTMSGGEDSTAVKVAQAVPGTVEYGLAFALGGVPLAIATAQPNTVDKYKQFRRLNNSPIESFLASQGTVLAEVLPERIGWHLLKQIWKLPADASTARVLRAIGIQQVGEHSEEQITNLTNWWIDRAMNDPTATPERLLEEAKETAKVTAFLTPLMGGATYLGGRAAKAAQGALDRRLDAWRAGRDTAGTPPPPPPAAGQQPPPPDPTDPAEISKVIAGESAEPPITGGTAAPRPPEEDPSAGAVDSTTVLGVEGEGADDATTPPAPPVTATPPADQQQGNEGAAAPQPAPEPVTPPATAAPAGEAPDGPPTGGPSLPPKVGGPSVATPVDAGAHEAATSPTNDTPEPTDGQKEAGNYKKGHVTLGGLDISIENPEGSERSGTDASGKPWSVKMKAHYGYIRGTKGKDKDHLDVFIKPGTEDLSNGHNVYIIDQKKPGNGHFDEHKIMLGYGSEEEARRAYNANYTKGWDGIRAVTKMSLADFRDWLREGDTTQPATNTHTDGDAEALTLPFLTSSKDYQGVPSAQIELQRFKSGKWGFGISLHTNVAGHGSAAHWREAKFDTREAALAAAVERGLKWTENNVGHASEESNKAHAEKHIPRIRKWLESLKPKGDGNAPDVRGDQGQTGEGSTEGQSPVQPGAEQGGGDLQQPPSGPTDVGGASGGSAPQGPKAPVGGDGKVGGPATPPKEPKAPKEPKPEKPKAPELTADQKIHRDIFRAIEGNDQEALAKILFGETKFTEENWPEIEPSDRLVRVTVGAEQRGPIEESLRALDFRISDRQDVTEEGKDPRMKISAIYRPDKKKIGDIGEKIGGKRADRYDPKDMDDLPSEAEKALDKLLDAVDKDKFLKAELPGQSFGHFMFLEALWSKVRNPLQAFGKRAGANGGAGDGFKQALLTIAEREGGINKLKIWAEGYAALLTDVAKLVEGTTRVADAADKMLAGLAVKEGSAPFENWRANELGARLQNIMDSSQGSLARTILHFKSVYSADEDSTDQTKREVKKPMEWPPLAQIVRKGSDYRKGKDVGDEDFKNAFGFRGVDFGNWVSGPERQMGLNLAYDALMDLATTTGLNPKAIGLGGKLALGFGARGKGGKAAATFHPSDNVINLTRTRGNGTAGHEWTHALDHYARENPALKMYINDLRGLLKSRPHMEKLEPTFRGKLGETISSGSDRNIPPRDRALKWANGGSWWSSPYYSIFEETNYYKNAVALDGGKTGVYWSDAWEIFARASESFQYDATKGATPYLVGPHIKEGFATPKNGYAGIPYPTAASGDRAYVEKVMRMFFDGLESDADGNVRVKDGVGTVRERLKAEAQEKVDGLVKNIDKIMEEMGIAQAPEVVDGSMTMSMFYHLRHGWWPNDKVALRRFVAEAHRKDPKEIDDMTLRQGVEDFEAALARYAGQLIDDWGKQGKTEREIFDALFDMYNRQPVLDVRTSTVIVNQQYSTPLPIGYISGLMGHVGPKTTVADFAAGNGLLVINANPKKVIANELDERRFKNLGLIEMQAHQGDALTARERGVYKPQEADTVMLNSPFGAIEAVDVDGYQIRKIDHLIPVRTLDAMADKGRAILIMGASRDPGVIGKSELDFFHWLYSRYNVVDHFEITGDLYRRQGASWPIRIIVIAGRSPSKLGRPQAIERLETRDAIWTRTLEARAKAATPVAEKLPGGVVGAGPAAGGRPGSGGKPGNDGGRVPAGAAEQGAGGDRPGGGGVRPDDDQGGVRPDQPGVPGGVGTDGVGGNVPVGPELAAGESGGRGAGERGGGDVRGPDAGGRGAGGPSLGSADLSDADLDDIFGEDAPPTKSKPKPQPPRVPKGGGTGAPRKPRAPKAAGDGVSDADIAKVFDSINELLDGPDAPARIEDLKNAAAPATDAAAEQAKKDADDPKLMADGGPALDNGVYKKLQPAFRKAWDAILAKAKAIRDALIAFRDWVVEKLDAKILPYAKQFIVEVRAEEKRQERLKSGKKPLSNAIPNPLQTMYLGASKGNMDGVMLPKDHAEAIKRALVSLESRIRNEYPEGVDQFVRESLGYASDEELHKHLFGYQVDSVALALDSMMRGKGFIIGDDTGVGKGRQAAAIAAWATRTGRVPIFLTVKDNLYSDLYRDLDGIGFGNPEWMQPTNTNFEIKDEENKVVRTNAKGEPVRNALAAQIVKALEDPKVDKGNPETFLPRGRKVLLTTYSQLSGNAGAGTRQMLEALLKTGRAVLVMDEAHNAAGESGVGDWMKGMLETYRPMTTYLSATYSKRADTLPVYLMTDIRLIAPDLAQVVDAIKAGGTQMQSTISEMLVEAGQMIRRERSYYGIKPNWDIDEQNGPRDARTMDEVTERLRAIFFASKEFQGVGKQQINEWVEELFPNQWAISISTKDSLNPRLSNFAAVAHNYIKQFLLAVKSDRIVEHTIAAMNRGEKVVIAAENTMEAALDYFVESNGLKVGDDVSEFSWATIMTKALEKSREVSIKMTGQKDPIRKIVPLVLLPENVRAAYINAQKLIESFASDLPASPLDYIRWKLGQHQVWQDANGKWHAALTPPDGVKHRPLVTSEITGRGRIVQYEADGTMKLANKDEPTARDIIYKFNNGGIDVALVNVSGATGVSLHAAWNFEDQRPRHMLVGQALGDIAVFKQLLGRINRTGQVELPLYTIVSTALPAEKRPLAVLRKKFQNLTSNTAANTENAQDFEVTDFINEYGDDVVTRWLVENEDTASLLDISTPAKPGEVLEDAAIQTSGKVALLSSDEQRAFYDKVEHDYRALIEELTAQGMNKLIRREIPLEAQLISENVLEAGQRNATSPFEKDAFLQKLSVKTQHDVPNPDLILDQVKRFLAGRTPEAVSVDIEKDLKLAYDEAMNQLNLRIAEYEKKKDDKDLTDAEKTRIADAWQAAKNAILKFASRRETTLSALRNNWQPGRVAQIKFEGEEMTAVVLGISYAKPAGGGTANPFSPSNFKISMVVNAPRPRLNLTLAYLEQHTDVFQYNRGNAANDVGAERVKQEFAITAVKKDGGRENRYMVVGNIPAGFARVKARGDIVIFTYDGHTKESPKVRTGILMPGKFNPDNDVDPVYRVRDADAAERFLMLPRDRAVMVNENAPDSQDDRLNTARRWVDLGYTAQEIFDIANAGMQTPDGAITLKSSPHHGGLDVSLTKGPAAKEYIKDPKLQEAMGGAQFTQPNRKWDFRARVYAKYVPTLVQHLAKHRGLVIDKAQVELFQRLSDHLASNDAGGEVKLMVASEGPKGVSGEARLSARLEQSKHLEDLRRSVASWLKRELPEGMFRAAHVPEGLAGQLKALGDFFGKTIVLFENTSPGLLNFQGATLPGNGKVIFINAKTTAHSLVVSGHEVLHAIRESDPKLYEALREALRPFLKNHASYQAYLDAQRKKIGAKPASADLIEEEMIADVLGDSMLDRRFWEQLMGREPTLGQRLLQTLIDWLAKLGVHLRKTRNSGSFLSDVHAARQAMLSVLRDWTRQEYAVQGGSLVLEPKLAAAQNPLESLARDMSLTDKVISAPFRAVRWDHWADRAWAKLDELNEKLSDRSGAWESVRAGVESDFGLEEEYVDRRVLMQVNLQQWARGAVTMLDKLGTLTRDEARVAYEWANQRDADDLLERLPERSRQTLQEIKELIRSLGQEAVRLKQLSPEVFRRNELAYLHRSYLKHEIEQTLLQRLGKRKAVAVWGEQYKGRGLKEWLTHAQLEEKAGAKLDPAGMKGRKFVRLEKRGQVTPRYPRGRLLKYAYIPEDADVPAEMLSWRRDGVWEVRWQRNGKWGLWRDMTPEERRTLGEIDEVRFAVAKTIHLMTHDIEVGRMQEWIAQKYGRAAVPDGGVVVSASESLGSSFGRKTWVKVPTTEIRGTNTLRYGALAGKFIPGPIWNDVRQRMDLDGRHGPISRAWDDMLRLWKISKTALSPGVHTNNVMANFFIADFHDVRAKDLIKAIRVLIGAKQKSPNESDAELYRRFEDSGALHGMFKYHELKREALDPILEEIRLAALQDEEAAMTRALSVVSWLNQVSRAGKAVVDAHMDAYAAEDEIFRLALFLKAVRHGLPDVEAGKLSRKGFLDYDINAPWIQALRRTAFPFIAFPYRAIPMMLHTFTTKPWKLVKYVAVAAILDNLAYLMLGMGPDDEEKERRLLAEEKSGKIWGLFPKMMRMPWNSEAEFGEAFDRMVAGDAEGAQRALRKGSTVFLDVRRWFPAGDIFDVDGTHAVIPISPTVMPGGPVALLGELMFNKSAFTGQPLTLSTDTAAEMAGKLGTHLYRFAMPNHFMIPGTWSFEGIRGALGVSEAGVVTDRFGREVSLPQSFGSALGVKIGTYAEDVAKLNIVGKQKGEQAEIMRQIYQKQAELQRNKISREQFQAFVAEQMAKVRESQRKAGEKLNPPAQR